MKEGDQPIVWKAEHDLEMFVKAVFWRCRLPDYMVILAEKNRPKLLAFWRSWLMLQPWCGLIAAARLCDYDTVSNQLRQLLPPFF
jgi:hypothetical protein